MHLKYALYDVQTIRRTVHFGPSVPEVVDGDATLASVGSGRTSILAYPAPKGGACPYHLAEHIRAQIHYVGPADDCGSASSEASAGSNHFAVGITNSAPLPMLSGQRCMIDFCLV